VDPYALLDFNAPLSDERAARLVAGLGPLDGARVLDLGCGWAELLLRVLAHAPTASGHGIDGDAAALARGRRAAHERGLAERVRLDQGDLTDTTDVADVVLSVASSHAWGDPADAPALLRMRVAPGGRLLLGDGFWRRPPTLALVEVFGELPDLAGLVGRTEAAGFRVLGVSESSADEWDDFESRWCAGREQILLADPLTPDAGALRMLVDEHRRLYLTGYRGVLGFAWLTLAVPA
jgi:SAM-dependent methyltransferase